ncbi:cupin domain-containing protein [Rhizobium sp. SSA_523]|uniref:cupin domain-containing protein n=1 Tax=Rhizobium sp. SSA_523 TaxID=2952477 RepID=UPI00209154AC|nr:cupin domain-containing protein [Rhizobium sp. SSA_523]MCO5733662.1 cupin domain-containing protein [Rhizobium sp. SSA_523]WKC23044.1 cupin domain-containing protein [Rhizobium sp. SSA_523]
MTADDIIAELFMQPHPEGGWYKETFRDGAGGERGHSTAIYYLLKQGENSHWHRVKDAVEIWHFYAGSPLRLRMARDGEAAREEILGLSLGRGEKPQIVVEADSWQSAESLGAFTLVGCTVAPGFSFSAFEMAPPGWEPTA